MHNRSLAGFISALGIALGSTGAMAGGWNDDDCDYCGRGYSSYYAPPVAYGYYAPRYRYGYGYQPRGYGDGYRVRWRHW
jgi:hypothetical protein